MPIETWLEDDRRPLDWNGPADRHFTRVRDDDLQRPIIEHFERVASRQRERLAIRDADTALTFGELWDGVSGLAETLTAQSRPGDLIGILLPVCPMFPVAMLACLASGRPFVALDARDPSAWLEHALREARPPLIITLESGLPRVEALIPTMRLLRLAGRPGPARPGWMPVTVGMDEPACVLFTSGSTGQPKSIVNSQRNLMQRVAQSINAAHINSDDTFLTLASLSTIVGVRDVITGLLAGACVRLLDPKSVGAREVVNVIGADAVTILFGFPALLRAIVAADGNRAGTSLRLVRLGGDTTFWSDITTLRAWLTADAFIQVVFAATEAPMLQWFVDDSSRHDDNRVPIGYPLAGNRLALVGDDGRAVVPGEIGELVVGSPYVALGRWAGGRFLQEGCETDGNCSNRIFRTGDLVRQRPDGLLERVGRKDREVKIRGVRVDLDGIEAMLRAHHFVRDVAAMARPGAAGGTIVVAYVTATDDAPAWLIDQLKALMRSAPSTMRPAHFHLTSSIPRLPNSKLDLRALAALDVIHVQRERGDVVDAREPAELGADRISQTVAHVWHTVLGVPVIAAGDDFFDSGGDSLAAITFGIELERALGVEIPLTLINEAPRFDQLCQALHDQRKPGASPLVTLKEGDGAPPIFLIHGAGGTVVKFLSAARRMDYPGAVIGVRARGLVRGEVPHMSIEAMAADYLIEIKRRQPSGPYYLCGYSSGGLVAFEIARRLSESGESIGLVGLFDTRVSPLRWPVRLWPAALWRMGSGFRQRLRGVVKSVPVSVLRIAASALIASARYQPGFYPGELTLFVPATPERGLPSLQAIWGEHARMISTVEIAGAHATMFSASNADRAAAALTHCLPVRRPWLH